MKKQFFPYKCPNCQAEMNAAHVAAALPDAVLVAETARRNGRRQTPHAGPGRPTVVRCPGCEERMTTAELRGHRVPCVRDRLNELQRRNQKIRLSPKDPDPYPPFAIREVSDEEVRFQKLSSGQYLAVELRKVAEIILNPQEQIADIRLLGRVMWDDSIQRWRSVPTLIGRPMTRQI